MTGETFGDVLSGIQGFARIAGIENHSSEIIMKAAGIAVIAELGVQICCDTGETAMAGRIRLAVRVVLLGMAMPLLTQISKSMEVLSGLLLR